MVRKSDRSSVRQRGLEHGPSFHVVHIPLNEDNQAQTQVFDDRSGVEYEQMAKILSVTF